MSNYFRRSSERRSQTLPPLHSFSFSDEPPPVPLSVILNPLRLGTRPYARTSPLAHIRKDAMTDTVPSYIDCRITLIPPGSNNEGATRETDTSIEVEAHFRPRIDSEVRASRPIRQIRVGKSRIKNAKHSRRHIVIGSLEQFGTMMAQPGKFSETRRRRRERHFARSAMEFDDFAL